MKNGEKSLIPYVFVGFFAVIFAVDTTFVYLAKKTSSGVHTKNSYYKGLHYNDSLALAKKQRELGWDLRLKYEKIGKNIGLVRAVLRDRDGNLIKDAHLKAILRRPTLSVHDFSEEFVENGDFYELRVTFPMPGAWDVEVQAFRGDDVMQKVKRYVVR